MREILFRGKQVDNGKWIYGSLIELDKDSGYLYICEPYLQGSTLSPLQLIVWKSKLVSPETVGQYTGLTDKNGIKIFEGDIVEQGNGKLRQVVEWEKWDYNDEFDNVMIATFMCKDKDGNSFYISKHDIVIGNIHENPELLKGE